MQVAEMYQGQEQIKNTGPKASSSKEEDDF